MDKPQALLQPVAAAAKCVGGATRLAEILGIKRPALYQWTRVPAERVAQIETATEGKVTRHQLRPDLYPANREADVPLLDITQTDEPTKPPTDNARAA